MKFFQTRFDNWTDVDVPTSALHEKTYVKNWEFETNNKCKIFFQIDFIQSQLSQTFYHTKSSCDVKKVNIVTFYPRETNIKRFNLTLKLLNIYSMPFMVIY
jgi:hypothetical protein